MKLNMVIFFYTIFFGQGRYSLFNVYLGNSNDILYDSNLINKPSLERIDPLFLNFSLKTENVRKQLGSKWGGDLQQWPQLVKESEVVN